MFTPTARLRPLTGALLALALIVGGAPWSPSQVASSQDQTLFVAFTDFDGAPVTDMTAEEVVIQWDDVRCEILELEPINWPVRVTLFIDNATESQTALPDMREGLTLFLDALPPDIEVAVATIAERPQVRARHTTDRGELIDAIGQIVSEGGASTFFDALYEEAERLHEDEEGQYVPVIVMVALSGSEGSSRTRGRSMERTMERLNANAAAVHTLLFTNFYGVLGSQGRIQARWGAAFAEATGGRYQALADASAYRTLLPELAEDLARKHRLVSNQYRVTYKPPKDASDQPRIQMGSSRGALTAFPSTNGNIP